MGELERSRKPKPASRVARAVEAATELDRKAAVARQTVRVHMRVTERRVEAEIAQERIDKKRR